MDQIDAITAAARGAQPNTALADAKVSVVGLPVVLKDTRDYSDHDLRLIIAMTVCIVLLILIVLLRAIVAPLYLIGSVIVSYLAALGIGVIVFQFLLGQEMHWSIPGLTSLYWSRWAQITICCLFLGCVKRPSWGCVPVSSGPWPQQVV